MLVRVANGSGGVDVVASIHDPAATIAHLMTALDPEWRGRTILVDGRELRAGQPLDRAGIGDGAEIRLDPPTGKGETPRASATWSGPARAGATSEHETALILVIDGADTGRRFPLAPGRYVLGRPGDQSTVGNDTGRCVVDDLTVSRHHLFIAVDPNGAVTLADAASTNGTMIDGHPLGARPTVAAPGSVLTCGAARLLVSPLDRDDPTVADAPPPRPARGTTTIPLHRRPRPPQGPDREPVPLPEPPAPPPAVTPVGILAVAASVILGAVLVILLRSWTYAAFALLGPVLMVANAVDSRRRRRRVQRSGARQRTRDLVALDDALTARHGHERTRRQRLHPGALAAVSQVRSAPTTCWQRRAGDTDAFAVRLGHGTAPWRPPLAGHEDAWPDDVAAVADRHRHLADAPVGCRLDPALPIAIVGPRTAGLALVRSLLVQAAVEHGPADLRIGVLCAPERTGDWDWCAWLPHSRGPAGDLLLAGGPGAAAPVTGALVIGKGRDGESEAEPAPARTLVVIDDPSQLSARRSPVRTVLRAAADPAAELVPIALVAHVDDVPALCRSVLHVSDDATLGGDPTILAGPATFTGVSVDVAIEVARCLARFDDPERDDADRALPAAVSLGDLLDFDPASALAIAARWRSGGRDPAARATIGISEEGPLVVDLAVDGPHALVAGTTGAGKSELLRTLVSSLALGADPDHLTFVLIDFKGGSAFDACARLPHVTGLVTDLDDHLATRALRCLEAELRYRERRLRQAGAEDLAAWRRMAPRREDPLPRLVVVIDEFATLAGELGDFVDALVGVAQRGRSLGVHLVLATQRPSGSVSDHIRANTNLRIALRVQDATDSRDVIDRPDAASLPRRRPGRALARLGPAELVPFQAALVTAMSTGIHDGRRLPVTVAPLAISTCPDAAADPSSRSSPDRASPDRGSPDPGRPAHSDADLGSSNRMASDLERLVDATNSAWSMVGGRAPRRAWPDPLPSTIDAEDPGLVLPEPDVSCTHLVIGLADDPDRQRHIPFAWRLGDGPLLAVGLAGSGTTTLALGAITAAARRWASAALHIHAIDLGSGSLGCVAELSQVGAVLGATEDERQRRLIADLLADLGHRQTHGQGDRPRRLLVIDGLGAFRARWDDVETTGTWAGLVDLLTRGTDVGIHVLVTADGSGPVPHQILGACRQRLLFRLADRGDHAAYGVAAHDVPELGPGRAIAAEGAILVQVARPARCGYSPPVVPVAVRASGSGGASGPAPPWRAPAPADRPDQVPGLFRVPVLPEAVALGSLRRPWRRVEPDGSMSLAVGVDDATLDVARLVLAPGGHALVAGPPRSGRTTALRTVAVAAAGADHAVVVVTSRPQEWTDLARSRATVRVLRLGDAGLSSHLDRCTGNGSVLIIVDDADGTDDEHRALGDLARTRRAHRHLIAAGRVDRLRGRYGHWTRELHADRTGLLLAPDVDLDGDLLGVRLPRRLGDRLRTGRGWLAGDGPGGLIQVAQVSPTPSQNTG